MSKYEVTVARMETITFEVEAESPEDACERYLMDGEEVASETNRLEVLDVKRDKPVVVVDEESASEPGDIVRVIARFDTVAEAEEYIAGLPDVDKVERGGYGIDAPEELVHPIKVGDWVAPWDWSLDAREVVKVEGSSIWIKIGTLDAGPLPAENYQVVP